MRRITISVDDDLADTFDNLVQQHGYSNRSEAFRDLLRGELGKERLQSGSAKFSVGALSYVYNHEERELARRLLNIQHDHHDLVISTMHAHLDHDNCIETAILQGPTAEVIAFAQRVIAEKGVRHGSFRPIPVEMDKAHKHSHTHRHAHPHT